MKAKSACPSGQALFFAWLQKLMKSSCQLLLKNKLQALLKTSCKLF